MKSSLLLPILASLAQKTFVPSPGNFPANGDDTIAEGIFSISLQDLATYLQKISGGTSPGSEAPKGAGQMTSGSGPYPAQMTTDSSIPNHTIYAPKVAPNITLPLIAFGNGACQTNGAEYRNFLTEIASYGYVIVADGPPGGGSGQQSKTTNMRASVDWTSQGKAAKFGKIDATKIATAGHSCGGLEAMSIAYHDKRVSRILMFNIAIFQDERRYLLEEINVPVAWFMGGPKDMGYPNANKDYTLLNTGLAKYKANLDTGYGGTYSATNGGKFGKAAVNYLEWQFRGSEKSKAILLDPRTPNSLVSDNWSVEYANWS